MKVERKRGLAEAPHARGDVVVIDVLRAFTTAAFAFSLAVWLVPLPGQHVYFEASAVVITLVLLGKLLEGRARARTAYAIRDLLQLQPTTVQRERDGEIREVPLAAMRAAPYGEGACLVGRVEADPRGRVLMRTTIGGTRIVDTPSGELLLRIC